MHWKTSVMLLSALILAALNFTAIAGGDKDKTKALQGIWTAAKGDKKMQMSFDGNKFKLEFEGKSASGTFTVDPATKPASMDLKVLKGSDEETMKFEGKTAKAIYVIEGNKLKWLANEPGKEDRPKAFPADGEKAEGLYLIFERAKK